MFRLIFLIAVVASIQGCVVAKVADAAVSTGASAVKTTGKVAGGAVDVVTPDGDKDDNKDK